MLERAANEAGIPLELILAGAIAESGLNPRAERWGTMTVQAQAAIAQGDMQWLQSIINATWPDISFGLSQKVVAYHYLGDRSRTVENCLAVREGVFADPERNLMEMAVQLNDCLFDVYGCDLSKVGWDPLLAALVVYNHGSYPPAWDDYWTRWAGNVASYRGALDRARSMI